VAGDGRHVKDLAQEIVRGVEGHAEKGLNAVVTNTWTSRCWVHLKGWKNSALIQYWKLFTTYIVVIKLWYCTKSELSFDFEEKTQTIKIKTPTNDRKYLQKDWKYESGEIECQLKVFFFLCLLFFRFRFRLKLGRQLPLNWSRGSRILSANKIPNVLMEHKPT
jgi:hypothetical protein